MKKLSELTAAEKCAIVAKFAGAQEFVGIKKLDMWYRENARGYTGEESVAGRFTREEAKKHEYKPKGAGSEWVTIHEFSTPDYLTDLNAIVKAIKRLDGRQFALFTINLKIIVGSRLLENYCDHTHWIDAETPEFTDALILTIGAATL